MNTFNFQLLTCDLFNTSGKLAATAYRTNGTDNWNYKYYRYDARGRVIKQWNIIYGLGTKVIEYQYNSQNQITNIVYHPSENDFREFQYTYDKAGRMETVGIDGIPDNLNSSFVTFASYAYNENSQTRSFIFDPISITQSYQYNSRNRLTSSTCTKQNLFSYNLGFQKNGNAQNQSFTGSYRSGFSETSDLVVNYTYDYSNRLLNANYTSPFNTSFDLTNTFDYDGNMLTLQRFGSNSNLIDNFIYSYYTGTNRLSSISTTPNLYQYDWNGNVTDDFFNNNTSIKYDNRNLITEITRTEGATDPPLTYTTNYYYDESGNRIRKTVGKDAGSSREIITDEIYVRDISGRELAIYDIRNTATLEYWNVWAGSELIGRINPTENDRYYYFKDHLGTIRAVYDNSKNIVYAQDYDMWGYPLQDRVSGHDTIKIKFTGKERDKETTYDYFGARFYDSRIGNWLSTDPLFEKYLQWTPYNYVLRNPLILIDPDGKQVVVVFGGAGLLNAGKEIDPENYSPTSSTGAEILLFDIKSYYENSQIPTSKIKGYYSSTGIFGDKNEINDAFNFIIEQLSSSDEQLFLYGYSQGGENIIQLSEILNDNGIKVTALFTVDAYSLINGTDFNFIPTNVKQNWNYYQEKPTTFFKSRGAMNIADDKEKTKVYNKKINNIDHNSIDEFTIPDVMQILTNKIRK